jgi:hypothetical protein
VLLNSGQMTSTPSSAASHASSIAICTPPGSWFGNAPSIESVRAMMTTSTPVAWEAALIALSFASQSFRGTSTLFRFCLPTLTMCPHVRLDGS